MELKIVMKNYSEKLGTVDIYYYENGKELSIVYDIELDGSSILEIPTVKAIFY